VVHSGSYSVRVQTISGPLSTVVNGNVTTGVVNAPSMSKADGYIGTVNYSTPTDIRHRAFTGHPDSLTGWYQYLSGGAGEQGKIRAIIHTGEYYDPETPTTGGYHPDLTANKIGDAMFVTPTSSVATWTRFAVPFTYVSSATPAYIMINATSSANQLTTITGSKLWLDDLQVTYTATTATSVVLNQENVKVYSSGKTVYVDFIDGNQYQSVLSVYDIAGRVVYSQAINNNQLVSINLSNLSSGMYLYQLSNSDFRKTGKLFLQ
jgi:Secretion system C-terminal sorting domain/Putative carbohydrate metabolism domain